MLRDIRMGLERMAASAQRTAWIALAICALAPASLTAQEKVEGLGQLSDAFERLSARVGPAVVQILATGYAPNLQEGSSSAGLLNRREIGGSGVILDPDGYVVTNAHVVAGAGRVQVRLSVAPANVPEGSSILEPKGKVVGAQIVGIDRETDIAVLKVDESNLPHLRLGDSDRLRQGQLVFAFGSPFGLEGSVTMGVVSAVARQLAPDDPMIYIQTDAPINPGNSGGPLVDPAGRVVGINTFILSQSGGSEGLGFAAPSNIVKNVYQQIKSTGYVSRGVIGVHAQTVTPLLAGGLGIQRDWGVILGDVYAGGPAHRAGLQIGDQILTLDGKVMENGRQLDVNLYGRPIGQEVALEVLRDGRRFTARVPVIERPGGLDRFTPTVTPDENLVRRLGILAINLNSSTAEMLPELRRDQGVVVVARAPDATYGPMPLQRGDVIYSANGKAVENLEGLRKLVDALQPGAALALQVERRGQLMFLAFQVE